MTAATTTAARAFRGTATEGRSEAELKELVRRYSEQRTGDERFAQWVARAAEDDLK